MDVSETDDDQEKAILIGIQIKTRTNQWDTEESLNELEQLATTAGAVVLHKVIQKRDKPDGKYHVGIGKAKEVKQLVELSGCNLLIFDDELSTRKVRNLEKLFDIRIIDRAELILDIFAQRAKSREGILQVELAQCKYHISRLTGKGISLSRLGGGIGTRGPGETKLEEDRRILREKIKKIETDLERTRTGRAVHRKRRTSLDKYVVAIIGYTNSGKSTLFNMLTNAEVLMEDKLFATLDPVVRKADLDEEKSVLIIDTVGFINKLPHHLIEAFKSTLEDLASADLLLHVIDASHPQIREQEKVIEDLIIEIGAAHIPIIEVFNKIDKITPSIFPSQANKVAISALNGYNIEKLKEVIKNTLFKEKCVTFAIDVSKGEIIAKLHRVSVVKSQKVKDETIFIEAEAEEHTIEEFKNYLYHADKQQKE